MRKVITWMLLVGFGSLVGQPELVLADDPVKTVPQNSSIIPDQVPPNQVQKPTTPTQSQQVQIAIAAQTIPVALTVAPTIAPTAGPTPTLITQPKKAAPPISIDGLSQDFLDAVANLMVDRLGTIGSDLLPQAVVSYITEEVLPTLHDLVDKYQESPLHIALLKLVFLMAMKQAKAAMESGQIDPETLQAFLKLTSQILHGLSTAKGAL